jgi:shikimate dehydrogenase
LVAGQQEGDAMSQFRAAGVIGYPVAQSRSPKLHGYWLQRYGIAGAYLPMPVREGQVETALRGLARGLAALGFAGCNVTQPHKEAAFRAVDRVDATARRMGAVNLVVVEPDGSLSGSNTDGYGFIENLRDGQPGWRAEAGPAVVLGAGGAARGIVVALLDAGVAELRLLNRTHARAETLAREIGGPIAVYDWEARHAALEGAALLVNTTNQGMTGQPPLDLRLDALPQDALVNDIITSPMETTLLRQAMARGNLAIGGLGMLIHQARPAFKAWFGVDPEPTAELRALLEASYR